MVKRLKLNEKTLREAEPKPGVSYHIFDSEVIGFAARVQAPLPTRPIERGRPGPGLLAHVLVSKYADHLPLL